MQPSERVRASQSESGEECVRPAAILPVLWLSCSQGGRGCAARAGAFAAPHLAHVMPSTLMDISCTCDFFFFFSARPSASSTSSFSAREMSATPSLGPTAQSSASVEGVKPSAVSSSLSSVASYLMAIRGRPVAAQRRFEQAAPWQLNAIALRWRPMVSGNRRPSMALDGKSRCTRPRALPRSCRPPVLSRSQWPV